MPTGHASLMPALKRVVLIGTRAERTDGQLLGAFVADRDADAFGLLVRRHGPMVLGVCRRVIGDHQSAEDAFQAVFLVLARRAATVRPREQVGNWLYGVAYRTALKARGVLARRRSREKQVVVMPEPPATHTPPEWADLQPVIDEELSRLPEKLRGPVVLCDIEGRPQREVAKHLGVPPATLATRLAAARRTLAQRLTKRGVALSGGAVAGLLTIHGSAAAVPHALAHGLARAAEAVAAGGAVSTLVSANAVQLSEGVLRMMLLTKLKAVAVAAMTAITLTGGLGLGLVPARAGGAGDDPAAAAVAKVVPAQIPPAADEARVEVALKAAAGGSVDDETFLKRMTLDLRGDLPTDIETFFFVDDRDDDKRAKVVAWLLDDDATREFAAKQLGVEAHRVVQVQAVDAGDGQPRRMVIVIEADEKGGKPAAHAVPVKGVAFSPDGKRLAVEVTPRVQMLDAKSGKVIELNAQVEGLKDRVIEVRGKGVPGAGGVLRLEALPAGGLFQPVQQPGAKPGEPGKKVVVWEAKDVQAVDGKPVVGLFSSVDDGVVRVWQAADGKKFEVTKTAKVAQGGGSDADFLRRAVTAARGREPSDLEQKYFTEDKDPKKREKLLDALLKEPEVQKKLGEDFKKRMLAGGADGARETKGYRVVPLQGKEGFFGFQVDPKFDGKQFEFKVDPKAFQFKLPDNLKVIPKDGQQFRFELKLDDKQLEKFKEMKEFKFELPVKPAPPTPPATPKATPKPPKPPTPPAPPAPPQAGAKLEKLVGELLAAKKGDAEILEAVTLAAATRLPTATEKQLTLALVAQAGDKKAAWLEVAKVLAYEGKAAPVIRARIVKPEGESK